MPRRDCGCDDDFFARSRQRAARPGGGMSNPREAHDKTVIMRHYRLMDHRKARPEAGIVSDQVSRSCGDRVRVYLDLDGAGQVILATYQGEGCSVSIASASMMCAAVQGRSLDDAACLARDVLAMLETKDEAEAVGFRDALAERGGGPDEQGRVADAAIDDLLALWSIRAIGARIPCAVLSWNILPALKA
jgi:nitrogen fixation NifU-like protein